VDQRLIALDRTLRLLSEHVDASQEDIAAELARTVVSVRIAPDLVLLPNVQVAGATLVNLLARSGLRVVPDVASAPVRTPLLTGSLKDGMGDLAERAFPGSIAISNSRPDVAVVIGLTAAPAAMRVIWLAADATSGGFSDSPQPFTPPDALAAMEPASMAAAECIRFAIRRLPPRSSSEAAWLAPIREARLPSPAAPRGPIDLGNVDVISAGAIVDSAIWTLVARGKVRGSMRVWDAGLHDLSNVNRYPTLTWAAALAELAKAKRLADLTISDIEIEAVERRFVRDDILVARRRILIGADDIRVRHFVQEARPDWMAIGATGHDEVRITEHEPDESCAICAHPHVSAVGVDPIPTIAPISFQAGLRLVSRALRFAAGAPTPSERRYATYWPLQPGASAIGGTPAHPDCPLHGRRVAA
jgi:hypothetical protein